MLKKPKKFYKKAKIKEVKKILNQGQNDKGNDSKHAQTLKDGKRATIVKEKKSPKNNRFIPERFRLRIFFFSGITILSFIGIVYIGAQVKEEYTAFEKADTARKQIENKLNKLEQTVVVYPGSRDVYLQLANLAYQLKDTQKARDFTEKSLALDPNYQPALDLNKRLEN